MKKTRHSAVRLVVDQPASDSRPVLADSSISGHADAALHQAVIGMALVDRELRYVHVNDGIAILNGLGVAEHLGKHLRDVLPRKVVDAIEPKFRKVLETGEPLLMQGDRYETMVHPGVERYYETSYWPETSQDGEVVGVRCLVQDLTDRRQAVEELRRAHGALQNEVHEQTRQLALSNASLEQSLAELERIYENTPIGLCLFDRELRFLRINRYLARLNDIAVEDHIGRRLEDLMPGVSEQASEAFRGVLESGKPIIGAEGSTPLAAGDGELIWRANAHRVTDSGGEVIGLSVVVQNITDIRLAQQDLEERLQFERLVADLSLSFSRLAASEVYGEIRRSLQRITECLGAERASVFELCESPRELRGIGSYSVPEIAQLVPEPLAGDPSWAMNRLQRNEPIVFERLEELPETAKIVRQIAAERGLKSLIFLPLLAGGDLVGALAISTVSKHREWSQSLVERVVVVGEIFARGMERRRAEAALEVSEERFRRMVEHAPDAMLVGGADGHLLQVNGLAERLFGYERGEMVGMRVLELVPDAVLAPHLARQAADSKERGGTGASLRGIRRRGLRKDGTEIPIEVSLTPIGSGSSAVAIASIRDASERIAREGELESALDDLSSVRSQLEAENLYLKQEAGYQRFEEIVGQSEPLLDTLRQIEQVAATDSTVLLYGETGTGKELLARAIHRQSRRSQRPMVTLNCGALQPSLVESELFGREKGAYTGASTRQVGRFEIADSSTLFLDEIGELLPEIQVKLLRVLEEGRFERLGNPRTLSTDVRIVAASNRDLEDLVRTGRFRQDLFYRLNVFPIHVPPLRERAGDIPLLVWSFIEEFSQAMGKTIDRVPQQSMDSLIDYDWPGNVRELRNVVERAMIISPSRTLQVSVPKASESETGVGLSFAEAQRRHILSVLERSSWRIRGAGGAAELLELKPTTLEYKMKKLEIRRA